MLSIKSCRWDSQVTMTLTGELDLLTVADVKAALADVALDDDIRDIFVDLSGVTFTDSTGIAALIAGKRLACAVGKRYDVIAAHGMVRRVLDLTGVWGYLSGLPD